jgi:hypothetical protein
MSDYSKMQFCKRRSNPRGLWGVLVCATVLVCLVVGTAGAGDPGGAEQGVSRGDPGSGEQGLWRGDPNGGQERRASGDPDGGEERWRRGDPNGGNNLSSGDVDGGHNRTSLDWRTRLIQLWQHAWSSIHANR